MINTEFYRNYPWESRVRAANRRIYKTSEHERYKEVISWIIEEIYPLYFGHSILDDFVIKKKCIQLNLI